MDELSSLCADLVSMKKYETFLNSLFLHQPGCSAPVSALCGDGSAAQFKLKDLEKSCGVTLSAVWLDTPELSPGFCTIIFFAVDNLWSYLTLFNREALLTAGLVP